MACSARVIPSGIVLRLAMPPEPITPHLILLSIEVFINN
jgi:hypothetical protein